MAAFMRWTRGLCLSIDLMVAPIAECSLIDRIVLQIIYPEGRREHTTAKAVEHPPNEQSRPYPARNAK